MLVEQLPLQVREVLATFHKAGISSAIVAGGAVRDAILGRLIKDIDVFISYEDASQPEFETNISNALGRELFIFGDSCSYKTMTTIEKVWSVGFFSDELEIQIIALKKGYDVKTMVADDFDFGLCQVYYDGNKIVALPGFIKDVTNKTFTLINCKNERDFVRSMNRYHRLSPKYRDYKYVDISGINDV